MSYNSGYNNSNYGNNYKYDAFYKYDDDKSKKTDKDDAKDIIALISAVSRGWNDKNGESKNGSNVQQVVTKPTYQQPYTSSYTTPVYNTSTVTTLPPIVEKKKEEKKVDKEYDEDYEAKKQRHKLQKQKKLEETKKVKKDSQATENASDTAKYQSESKEYKDYKSDELSDSPTDIPPLTKLVSLDELKITEKVEEKIDSSSVLETVNNQQNINTNMDSQVAESKNEEVSETTSVTETQELVQEVPEIYQGIFEYDDLIENLKSLSTVQQDGKLSTSTGKLMTDNMWFGTVTRALYGEGRGQVHLLLKKIVKSAEHHSKLLIDEVKKNKDDEESNGKLERLTADLASSRAGICNLIIKYRDDKAMFGKFYMCWEELSERAYKNMDCQQKITVSLGTDKQFERSDSKTETQEEVKNEEVPEMYKGIFSYDDLIENLKSLSTVVQDEKLSTSTGKLTTDNMWFGTITRAWCGEGRTQTHYLIKKIVRSADHHSKLLIDDVKKNADDENQRTKLNKLSADLAASRTGICNLIISYRDDKNMFGKLYMCWEELCERAYKNMRLKQ